MSLKTVRWAWMDGELQLSLAPGHGLAVGSEFMLHRVLVDGRWQACPVGTAYATADNIIHRYDREVGFAVSAADQAEEDSTPAVHQAAEAARQDPKKSWSHWQRVSRMALFIRWLRARCPTSPYEAWLRELERGIYAKQNGEHFERLAYKVRLHIPIVSAHDNHPHAQACPALSPTLPTPPAQMPPTSLIEAYIAFMDNDPLQQVPRFLAGSIKAYVAAISGTCGEFATGEEMNTVQVARVKSKVCGSIRTPCCCTRTPEPPLRHVLSAAHPPPAGEEADGPRWLHSGGRFRHGEGLTHDVEYSVEASLLAFEAGMRSHPPCKPQPQPQLQPQQSQHSPSSPSPTPSHLLRCSAGPCSSSPSSCLRDQTRSLRTAPSTRISSSPMRRRRSSGTVMAYQSTSFSASGAH